MNEERMIEIGKQIKEVLREKNSKLLETAPLPPHIKVKRAKERKKDTEERQRQAKKDLAKEKKKNKMVRPFEDIYNDFKTWSNGVFEEELTEEDEELEEAGKKKPACGGIRGSALYHDENGHFTGKKDAVVRSLKKHTGSDCRHGTQRVKGNNDSIAAPAPCGSKEQTYSGGVGKHKKKCKKD